MVKKQEKFQVNEVNIVGQTLYNRNLQTIKTNRHQPNFQTINSSKQKFQKYKQFRRRGSAKSNDKKDGEEDSDGDLNNPQVDKNKLRQQIYYKFRLDPNQFNNEDGSPKFVVRTRLMNKIEKMKVKPDNAHSDDEIKNSFDEEASEISEENEEDDQESKKKKKIKKQKKPKKKQLFPNNPKIRKPIMNVYCTEYDVVKKAAKNMCGFRLREYPEDQDGAFIKGQGGQKLSEEWDVSWHNLPITPDFLSKLMPYQKVSQFPGIQCISKKHNLCRNLMKMKKFYPEHYSFFPRTWILPAEAGDFHNMFIDKVGRPIQRNKTYIVKPDNLCQGKGIYLSRNYEKIVENCNTEGQGWVVQEYLSSPHLIEDLKYDLRIYVLLYGLNPLRIFIHEQGIARFATEPYEKPNPYNLDNMFVHLTNYAINKNNSNFLQNNKKAKNDDYGDYDDYDDDDDEETGHKRSLFAILKIIYQQGGDPDKIWDEIKDIIVKTVVTGQPYMNHLYRISQPDSIDNSMCFQVLGFDIMIDKNFRPWLLEVNQSPSFATDSPLDYEVKKNVLRDTFNLLNISAERREEAIKLKQKQDNERIMTGKTTKVSNQERQALQEQAIAERIEFERQILARGSGFEMLFPQIYDEGRHQIYETLLKGAQTIWDDFTTGKNKKQKNQQPTTPLLQKDKKVSQNSIEIFNKEIKQEQESDKSSSHNDNSMKSKKSIKVEEVKLQSGETKESLKNLVNLKQTLNQKDQYVIKKTKSSFVQNTPQAVYQSNEKLLDNFESAVELAMNSQKLNSSFKRKVFSQYGFDQDSSPKDQLKTEEDFTQNLTEQQSNSNMSNPQGSST